MEVPATEPVPPKILCTTLPTLHQALSFYLWHQRGLSLSISVHHLEEQPELCCNTSYELSSGTQPLTSSLGKPRGTGKGVVSLEKELLTWSRNC